MSNKAPEPMSQYDPLNRDESRFKMSHAIRPEIDATLENPEDNHTSSLNHLNFALQAAS